MFREGDKKIFEVLRFILVLFIIIFVGSKINFIFKPLVVFIQTVTFPVLLAGVIYYLTNPLNVYLVKRLGFNKLLSILIIFILITLLIVGVALWIGPLITEQIESIYGSLPYIVNDLQIKLSDWGIESELNKILHLNNIDDLYEYLLIIIKNNAVTLGSNVFDMVGKVFGITILVVVIPFILFYMLKDGDKFKNYILRTLSEKHRGEGEKILDTMNSQLSSYVQGQFIVSASVGIMALIGFIIVGLDYALLLSFIVFSTNFVPFVGPFIGSVPALVVALLDSPSMFFKVTIIILIAQQIESNIISPQVMGKKLNIHPLTIIILLLVSGRFLGIIGMLLAIPTYVVCRVVIVHVWVLWKLRERDVK